MDNTDYKKSTIFLVNLLMHNVGCPKDMISEDIFPECESCLDNCDNCEIFPNCDLCASESSKKCWFKLVGISDEEKKKKLLDM